MYCGECGEECTFSVVDNGFGSGEFGGAPYNHHDYQIESDCCTGEVFEDEELTIPYSYRQYCRDEEDSYEDAMYEQKRDDEDLCDVYEKARIEGLWDGE